MLRRAVPLLAALAFPLALAAQEPSRTVRSTPYTQTISINPIGLPFGFFSGEYEFSPTGSGGVTLGIGGTYATGIYEDDSGSDDRDAWVEGRVMYYPSEVPLRGFSVGLTAGYHNARNDGSDLFEPGGVVRSEGAPTVGVLLNYNWLIGARRRFLVGTGIGAKRVLTDVASDSPLSQVYPDGRLQIGLAF